MISTNEKTHEDTITKIKSQIAGHDVLLYMKGTADFPQCGFSAHVVHILNALQVNYETIDILSNPDIRKALPAYANWPTFPQLYIRGELIGGCDIVSELYESGELETQLKSKD